MIGMPSEHEDRLAWVNEASDLQFYVIVLRIPSRSVRQTHLFPNEREARVFAMTMESFDPGLAVYEELRPATTKEIEYFKEFEILEVPAKEWIN